MPVFPGLHSLSFSGKLSQISSYFSPIELNACVFLSLQTMLSAIKMEVMTPSVDSPDEGNIGCCFC